MKKAVIFLLVILLQFRKSMGQDDHRNEPKNKFLFKNSATVTRTSVSTITSTIPTPCFLTPAVVVACPRRRRKRNLKIAFPEEFDVDQISGSLSPPTVKKGATRDPKLITFLRTVNTTVTVTVFVDRPQFFQTYSVTCVFSDANYRIC